MLLSDIKLRYGLLFYPTINTTSMSWSMFWFMCVGLHVAYWFVDIKGKRNVQGVPQSQATAFPENTIACLSEAMLTISVCTCIKSS